MTKIAAVKTTKDEKVREAKRAFLLGLADLSWRLATAFLVPVLAGIAIDNRRGESKTFTIIGALVGFVFAFLVIVKLAIDSGVKK